MPANTAIADLSYFSDFLATMDRHVVNCLHPCAQCRHFQAPLLRIVLVCFRSMGKHGPAFSNYCRPCAQCRHFRCPAIQHAGKHRYCRIFDFPAYGQSWDGNLTIIGIHVPCRHCRFPTVNAGRRCYCRVFPMFPMSGQPWVGMELCAQCRFPEFQHFKMPANTVIAEFPICSSSGQPWAGNFSLLVTRTWNCRSMVAQKS